MVVDSLPTAADVPWMTRQAALSLQPDAVDLEAGEPH